MKFSLLLLALAASFFGTPSLHATTFTWTGLAGDNDVANGANWLGGIAPGGITGTEDLVFAAPGSFTPSFNGTFSVNDITFPVNGGFYNLTGSGVLTLNGGMTTQAGATNGVLVGTTLTFAAGMHTFNTAGSDIYLFSDIDGAGGIRKTGAYSLWVDNTYYDMFNPANSFTGGVDLQQGTIRVNGDSSLGTGLVMMNGGTLIARDDYANSHLVNLTNDLSLSASATFGETNNRGSLTFTGNTTIQAGVADVMMDVIGLGQLTLNNIGEIDALSGLHFGGGGNTRIVGLSTYTGSTVVTDGIVVFASGALPTAGPATLKVINNAYFGYEGTVNMQPDFIDQFNKATTTGIIGLDSPDLRSVQVFDDGVDLAGFDSNARFGSSTAAILNGTFLPQGSTYQFGGIGQLTVNSDLTGSRDVTVTDGLQLFLNGNNDYDGGTFANGGAVVFTANGAVPASGSFSAASSGYIGYNEGAGLLVTDFLGKFNAGAMQGVVGFDSTDISSPVKITEDIDLSGFNANSFIGTSTAATLGCSIIITPAGSDYRFTGFRNGQLIVESYLTGGAGVVIGLNGSDIKSVAPFGQTFSPSVTLTGTNDYTGGTILQSGLLILGNSSALGAGALTINTQYSASQPSGIATNTPGLVIPNDIYFNSAYGTYFGGDNDFTLSGILSGGGYIDKVGDSTLTLTGDNSGAFMEFYFRHGTVIAASDTALGTGLLHFTYDDGESPVLEFSSANPTIFGLQGGYTSQPDGFSGPVIRLDSGTQLTINQSSNQTYGGQIQGSGDNGIVKTGTGTLTLTGPGDSYSYQGGTTINQGALVVSGQDGRYNQLGSGPIVINNTGTLRLDNTDISPTTLTVNSGGSLQGVGQIFGNVSVESGATLAPGIPGPGSVGTLVIGDLTLKGGGVLQWNLATPTSFDQVVIGFPSTLHIDSSVTSVTPFVLQLISVGASGLPGTATGFLNQSYTWTLFDANGSSIVGYIDPTQFSIDSSQFMTDVGPGSFTFALNGNLLDLTFTPVPEPSTYALLGLGLGAIFLRVRRRRA